MWWVLRCITSRPCPGGGGKRDAPEDTVYLLDEQDELAASVREQRAAQKATSIKLLRKDRLQKVRALWKEDNIDEAVEAGLFDRALFGEDVQVILTEEYCRDYFDPTLIVADADLGTERSMEVSQKLAQACADSICDFATADALDYLAMRRCNPIRLVTAPHMVGMNVPAEDQRRDPVRMTLLEVAVEYADVEVCRALLKHKSLEKDNPNQGNTNILIVAMSMLTEGGEETLARRQDLGGVDNSDSEDDGDEEFSPKQIGIALAAYNEVYGLPPETRSLADMRRTSGGIREFLRSKVGLRITEEVAAADAAYSPEVDQARGDLVDNRKIIFTLLLNRIIFWPNDPLGDYRHPAGHVDTEGTFIPAFSPFVTPATSRVSPCDSNDETKETLLTAALQLNEGGGTDHREFFVGALLDYCLQVSKKMRDDHSTVNVARDLVRASNSAGMTPAGLALPVLERTGTVAYVTGLRLFQRLCAIDNRSVNRVTKLTKVMAMQMIRRTDAAMLLVDNIPVNVTSMAPFSLACRLGEDLDLASKLLPMGADVEGRYGIINFWWNSKPMQGSELMATCDNSNWNRVYFQFPQHQLNVILFLLENGAMPNYAMFVNLFTTARADIDKIITITRALLDAGAKRGFANTLSGTEQTLAEHAMHIVEMLVTVGMRNDHGPLSYKKNPDSIHVLIEALFHKRRIGTDHNARAGKSIIETGGRVNLLPCPREGVARLIKMQTLRNGRDMTPFAPAVAQLLMDHAVDVEPEETLAAFVESAYKSAGLSAEQAEADNQNLDIEFFIPGSLVQLYDISPNLEDLLDYLVAEELEAGMEGAMAIIKKCQSVSVDTSQEGLLKRAWSGPAGYIPPNQDGDGGE